MKGGDLIAEHLRIIAPQEKALKRLGLETIEDMLYHFPRHYGDAAGVKSIAELIPGENAVIFGEISGLKTKKAWRKKISMAEAKVADATGSAKIVWFHQPYLAKMLTEGSFVRVEGKYTEKGFSNPKVEPAASLFDQKSEHSLYPVYPESRGVTSNWFYHALKRILTKDLLGDIEDPIPHEILKKYNLPSLQTALVWIHQPKKLDDAEAARKRFAFEEIFFIQLEKAQAKHAAKEKPAFSINKNYDDVESFVRRFPFEATGAQKRAIEAILADFKKGHPMSRLLEGDVGSGKTAVAATAAYAAVLDKCQVAYMAPTEILARQHFDSFISYFRHLPVQIALITGSGCLKFPSKLPATANGGVDYTNISRSQLLKWVANGEIAVVIGTHALIQKSVKFKRLALAIIDEQHRFGIAQRQQLVSKTETIPHLLSMTATPIPRTLALTLYGDLDLTLLDEMPAGRKKIITEVVMPGGRSGAYSKIREELKSGRQLYVICPRIDEPDPAKELAIQAKSVKEEAKRLKADIFPEYRIEILHSKMKPAEKERIMQDFKSHKIDILVSTSVVEVGVNVENASLIVIEGAERFGLSQLHQLRGRVLRGTHQPYCYVFADSKSEKIVTRLNALKSAKNGFELAEFDLETRGAGALASTRQWGISDLAMEAIKNLKMVEAAREEARRLVESGEAVAFKLKKIHFE